MESLRIVLTGGVSGGHTFPLLAVAAELRKRHPNAVEFLFVGPEGPFGGEAFERENIPAKRVAIGKWRRYFSLQNFIDPFKIPFGFAQALWHLFVFMPDAVFAKGGSASVPVALAAWCYRIPVLIHDSDATAGLANRFLGRFATRIAIAYPGARKFFPPEKTALTGNPVRQEILDGSRERAQSAFGLQAEKPLLLVIGGSLGASALNEALLRVLPEMLQKGMQVVHQTGEEHYEKIAKAVTDYGIRADQGYLAKAFLSGSELGDLLAASDVVLSRAGAGSIAEIAAHSKAAILVPLASAANDEQRLNAHDIAHIGGAVVLEEANLGEHLLINTLADLLGDAAKREALGTALRSFHHPDAAANIADGIESMIH